MIKPTLLVLAAGMGSRYGSLKQMDGVGPGNEAIIDYSVYDAIRAGFGKVVFVIRHSFASDFQEVFTEERFGGRIRVSMSIRAGLFARGVHRTRRACETLGNEPCDSGGEGCRSRAFRRNQCR